jgi:hypothetical protein
MFCLSSNQVKRILNAIDDADCSFLKVSTNSAAETGASANAFLVFKVLALVFQHMLFKIIFKCPDYKLIQLSLIFMEMNAFALHPLLSLSILYKKCKNGWHVSFS